ncbi:hypothetical protein QJS10_CPB11g01303 [Acorus calamus]|uniref:Cytochrome P450 n=1 Tax=Acorus calamus TaxID=4465 RepID=A0AAV9DS49_ACOCL|nr:hypothetical protein QJS10_CPB11g01303 [Acorus calamus]
MRTNTAEEWLRKRIEKYGPISKLTLFGRPTVFITGPAANKFLFTNEGNKLASQQPKSITRLLGARNVMEMVGEEHRRMRRAIEMFLRPEVLKRYVGKMEDEVKRHLEMHWCGRGQLKVMPLMKTLTFDIISSLLFGLEQGRLREALVKEFNEMMEGMWAVPVNLPFTRFNKSIRASQRIRSKLSKIVHDKRVALDEGRLHPTEDLITSLLSFGREEDARSLIEEEILDNVIIVMVAGHDTSSILITFLMRQLAKDPKLYEDVLREQEEIAKNKVPGEKLTWEDLAKMKYTWRVAMETLRMVPPVFGSFRRVLKEVEYGGYRIPEGWQILWASNITHYDEQLFSKPRKFDPTRFENQSEIPPYSFVAFGGGARICPGFEFAKLETLVVIHHLVTQFKWRLCGKDDSFIRDPLPSPFEGLPIHLEQKNVEQQ